MTPINSEMKWLNILLQTVCVLKSSLVSYSFMPNKISNIYSAFLLSFKEIWSSLSLSLSLSLSTSLSRNDGRSVLPLHSLISFSFLNTYVLLMFVMCKKRIIQMLCFWKPLRRRFVFLQYSLFRWVEMIFRTFSLQLVY